MKRPRVPFGECRDCREPISWVQLDTGKRMPVNPVPSTERGNVACRVIGGQLHGYVVSREHPADPLHLLMVPHVATCEEANRPAPVDRDPGLF